MNKSFLTLLFLIVVAVIAADNICSWLTSHIPAPWYIEGLYRIIPLFSLVGFVIKAHCNTSDKSNGNVFIQGFCEEDYDSLLFIYSLPYLPERYLILIWSVNKENLVLRRYHSRLRYSFTRPPFTSGYVRVHRENGKDVFNVAVLS